jgi:N4-gp56 family major capsid protein
MPITRTTDMVTTLSPIPDPSQTYYVKQLLKRAKDKMLYSKYADEVPLPKHAGKNVMFRRYAYLPLAQVPLAEGVPPTGHVPTLADQVYALQQFGDYIAITDLLDYTAIDNVQSEWVGLLGDQYGMTMDAVDRDVVTGSGFTTFYSNGTTRAGLNTAITAASLDLAIRHLTNKGAEKILGGNAGTTTVGTVPVMPAYVAITTPDVMYTVQNIPGYRSAQEYRGAAEDEVGRYRSIAFFESPDPFTAPGGTALGSGAKVYVGGGATGVTTTMKNDGTNANVYSMVIFGKHAFTVVPVDALSSRLYRKPLGSSGVADPIDQIMSIGWKNTSARGITNPDWAVKIESAAII